MIGCALCKRQLQKGEWEGWENMYVGLVCPDHNHEDICSVIAIALDKIKETLKASAEEHARDKFSAAWPFKLSDLRDYLRP